LILGWKKLQTRETLSIENIGNIKLSSDIGFLGQLIAQIT
jgi:hypothetical protein